MTGNMYDTPTKICRRNASKCVHKNQYRIETNNIMTASALCLQKNWLCYQNKDTNYIRDKFILLHHSERKATEKYVSEFFRIFEQLIFSSHPWIQRLDENVQQT